MAESGRYLYAVGRRLDPEALSGVRGLRDRPLEQVPLGDLTAVVSTVPLAEFGEEPLKRNLESLPWLEEVARAHDRVVQEVARHGPTAPLRLATICVDDASVRARLAEWLPELERVLSRVEGRAEWSVKVIVPPEGEPVAAAGAGSDGADAGGAAYLRRKKAQSEARRERQERNTVIGDRVHDELAAAAVASRLLRPQDPQLTGHVGSMVLNGAYLVDEDANDAFTERVADIARAHPDLTVECGGPWPPYSFAVLEQP